jgi:hypothetical protein
MGITPGWPVIFMDRIILPDATSTTEISSEFWLAVHILPEGSSGFREGSLWHEVKDSSKTQKIKIRSMVQYLIAIQN